LIRSLRNPGTRNALLITAVVLLGVGISAATLSSTVETGAEGSGGGGGGFQSPPQIPDLDQNDESNGNLPPIVAQIIAALLVLGALMILVYGLIYRKQVAVLAAVLIGAAVVVWLFIQLLNMLSAPDGVVGGWFDGLSGFTGGSGSDGGEISAARNLLFLVAVAVLGVLGIYLFSGADRQPADPDSEESEEDAQTGEEVTEMGKIAGRAADRIENRDTDEHVDNQVYEAYSEMTAQLDVTTDQSTTPQEFADAAAEEGMAANDVAALTTLFEAVRYGGYAATADREQEAVETLRRIERRYTDE
jgi:hypothetical protein